MIGKGEDEKRISFSKTAPGKYFPHHYIGRQFGGRVMRSNHQPFMQSFNILTALSSVALAAGIAPQAHAQTQAQGPLLGSEIPFDLDKSRNVSVSQRPKPELTPQGMPIGALRLYPEISTELDYSTNVYGLTEAAKGDASILIAPSLNLSSDWSRHFIRLRASGDIRRMLKETVRNQDGYAISAESRLDIDRESYLYALGDLTHSYETQYSGSFPANSAGPVPVDRLTGVLRGVFVFNRFRTIANLDVTNLNYHDNKALNGTSLDQDYRDRNIVRASVRGEYSLTPETAAFLQASVSRSTYDGTLVGQPQRDSDELRVLGGLAFDLSNLVRARIGAGYVYRDYKSSFYPPLKNFAFEARIEYFLSPITTVSLVGKQSIEDSIVGQSPGYRSTTGGARIDHELLRNLILYVDTDYAHDNFAAITRRDNQYRLTAGANYTAFRNLVIEPKVSYIDRKSRGDFQGPSFNEFRIAIKTTIRL